MQLGTRRCSGGPADAAKIPPALPASIRAYRSFRKVIKLNTYQMNMSKIQVNINFFILPKFDIYDNSYKTLSNKNFQID